MSDLIEPRRAKFIPQSGKDKGQEIEVHFNPVSLQYTVSNTLEKGKGNDKKQYVTQSTGKLTMDLVFDTTTDGQDVRTFTEKIARFMEPDEKKIPPIIQFEWGTYKFQGMVESYKETIDFFSADGVPLRASINLTLARQDKVFEPTEKSRADTQAELTPEPVEVPAGSDQSPTSAATMAGDPRAARSLAAANGFETLRFPSGPVLTVGAGVQLRGPAAFATGGAGISAGASLSLGGGLSLGAGAGGGLSAGISAGIGGGVSAGISAGIGGGVGAGASFGASAGAGIGGGLSAGAGLGIGGGASLSTGASLGGGSAAGLSAGTTVRFGGSASAGVAATAGAFAGLRVGGAPRPLPSLDPSRLLPPAPGVTFATDQGASFRVGGQARIAGSTSLGADVGATATLSPRRRLEG